MNTVKMEKGFAVMQETGKEQWDMVAAFSGWVDAHNHLHRCVGANRGKVVKVKDIKGEIDV
jgi:hypothetical protein